MKEEKTREDHLERIREFLIELLLEIKHAYIRAGAVPTKHIDQIQDRIRVAARTSSNVAEWYTTLSRKLNLGAPRSSTSSILDELVFYVVETVGDEAFLNLVEREHAYLIASMRLAHEQQLADRKTSKPKEEKHQDLTWDGNNLENAS